jgi:hypothetical protein
VTLNQRARKVSPRDIVALDEDNAIAVTTRRMIDEYQPFQREGMVAFSSQRGDPNTDMAAIHQCWEYIKS